MFLGVTDVPLKCNGCVLFTVWTIIMHLLVLSTKMLSTTVEVGSQGRNPQKKQWTQVQTKTHCPHTLCLSVHIPAVIKHNYKSRVKLMELVQLILFYSETGRETDPEYTHRNTHALKPTWYSQRMEESRLYHQWQHELKWIWAVLSLLGMHCLILCYKTQMLGPLHSVNSRQEYVMAKVYQLMRAMLEQTAHITTHTTDYPVTLLSSPLLSSTACSQSASLTQCSDGHALLAPLEIHRRDKQQHPDPHPETLSSQSRSILHDGSSKAFA